MIAEWIARGEDLVASFPLGLSQPVRPRLLYFLSVVTFRNCDKDSVSYTYSTFCLDVIVLLLTGAVLILSRPILPHDSTVGPALYIARALLLRFDREKQPSDLEYGVKSLRLLLGLPLSAQITGVRFAAVVTELVEALSHEIEPNQAKQRENIEEMLALYCKLPSWRPLNKDVAHILSTISRNVFRHSFRTGILDYVEQSMVHLRHTSIEERRQVDTVPVRHRPHRSHHATEAGILYGCNQVQHFDWSLLVGQFRGMTGSEEGKFADGTFTSRAHDVEQSEPIAVVQSKRCVEWLSRF